MNGILNSPMGERRKAVHASAMLSTNGFSAFQLPLFRLIISRIRASTVKRERVY
jgi:hypothetical protein